MSPHQHALAVRFLGNRRNELCRQVGVDLNRCRARAPRFCNGYMQVGPRSHGPHPRYFSGHGPSSCIMGTLILEEARASHKSSVVNIGTGYLA